MAIVITTSAGGGYESAAADSLQHAIYSLRGPWDNPQASGDTRACMIPTHAHPSTPHSLVSNPQPGSETRINLLPPT